MFSLEIQVDIYLSFNHKLIWMVPLISNKSFDATVATH